MKPVDGRVLLLGALPPTINHYYGSGNRRKWITTRGVMFRALVLDRYRADYPTAKPLTGDLSVQIIFQPATKRRMDVDNRIKPLLDACTLAGLWVDDSQVKHLEVRLLPPVRGVEACRIQATKEGE